MSLPLFLLSWLLCGPDVRALAADDFDTREAAQSRLAALGPLSWPALRRARARNPDVEVKRRAAELLAGGCTPAWRQAKMCVWAGYLIWWAPPEPGGTPCYLSKWDHAGVMNLPWDDLDALRRAVTNVCRWQKVEPVWTDRTNLDPVYVCSVIGCLRARIHWPDP